MSEPMTLTERVARALCGRDPWDCYIADAHAALAAIEASGDWAVVPVVPTMAMLTAHKAYCDKIYDSGNAPTAIGAWRAKIAARPKVTG